MKTVEEVVVFPPLNIEHQTPEHRIPVTEEVIMERKERIIKALKNRNIRSQEQAARCARLKRTRKLLCSDLVNSGKR